MEQRRRGRPKKAGKRSPEFFYRTLLALATFDRARAAGNKYDVAIDGAVDTIRKCLPETPVSRTEVKRVVARRYIRESEVLVANTEATGGVEQIELVKSGYAFLAKKHPKQFAERSWSSLRILSFGIGPEPRVRRINSREV